MFKDKKVLVIVPHQDDEINLTGGILSDLSKNNNKIHVLYTTNGDYCFGAKRRMIECLKSCQILGICEENVHFLGYGDQYSKADEHLFNTSDFWTSKKGYRETYGPGSKNEECYRYKKEHHLYNRQNFESDIQLVIEKIRPDIIYAIDFDSHCDHRATSLAAEKAIGDLIGKDNSYRPRVYKGFAYPTAYFGAEDFGNINLLSTKFVPEKHSISENENPYFAFDKRTRFCVDVKNTRKTLWRNPVFKALSSYKTQIIIKHAFSIINGDQIFWQRRTDNLLNDSEIKVTSGNKSKLNDFMLFECKDVLKGNTRKPKLVNNSWEPTDNSPRIDITLKAKKQISQVNIYNSVGSDRRLRFDLYLDDELFGRYDFKESLIDSIENINRSCKKISLVFDLKKESKISISELEIFEEKESDIEFIAAMDGNDDFMHNSVIGEKFKLKVYAYDGQKSRILKPDECCYYIDGKEMAYEDITFEKLPRRAIIKIELKNNRNVTYCFSIRKSNVIIRKINGVLNCMNKTYLYAKVLEQKIERKLFRKWWTR